MASWFGFAAAFQVERRPEQRRRDSSWFLDGESQIFLNQPASLVHANL